MPSLKYRLPLLNFMDRLVVILKKVHFQDFKSGSKTYELRGYGKRYNEKFVYTGRNIDLRNGYSKEGLKGYIGRVEIGNLDEILSKTDYKKTENLIFWIILLVANL